MGPGCWGPCRSLGFASQAGGAKWELSGGGQGEICVWEPPNSTLLLLQAGTAPGNSSPALGTRVGRGFPVWRHKLCSMYGQSAFSWSVGRSKALKHQTKAGEVNWEYKRTGKCEASPLISHSSLFLLPYSPDICVLPAQCQYLICLFVCFNFPPELTIQNPPRNAHEI